MIESNESWLLPMPKKNLSRMVTDNRSLGNRTAQTR